MLKVHDGVAEYVADDFGGIGGYIRRRRRLLGMMTQEQLAEKTGLSQKRISQIEAHREPGYLPPLDNLIALSAALECTVEELTAAAGYTSEDSTQGFEIDPYDPLLAVSAANAHLLTDEQKAILAELIRQFAKEGRITKEDIEPRDVGG